MGKSVLILTLLSGVVTLGGVGTSYGDEKSKLVFEPAARVIAKSKQGVVIRGEMKSLSSETALIVPDRSRFRNPNGVEYKLEKLQSLNIPDVEIKWTNGEDAGQFLIELSKQEELPIFNLAEFKQSELMNAEFSPSTGDPGGTVPDKKIVMQPAKLGSANTDSSKPTVTIICGNCFREVAVDSETGQKCPHCGILWDNSPVKEAELASGKSTPNSPNPGGASIAMNPVRPVNLGANVAMHQNPRPGGAPQQAVQAGQPVVVPQPVQFQTQPEELTLENLPLWLKVGVFCACMGILYYAVFVR